jgi:K+ transporter
LAGLGILHITRHPEILTALSPHHGLAFFLRHGLRGALILGSVVLVVTGGEALYADIAAASASGLGVTPGLIGERLHRTSGCH